jgi:D-psicose/D-tagatose/L-ribulose 3-epimerase
MRFGAHIFLFSRRWDDAEAAHLFDRAAALDMSCLEIAVGDDVILDAKRTGQLAAERGIALIFSPGGEWPMHLDLSAADCGVRKSALDWHCDQVHMAAEAGAFVYCGALYGHPGQVLRRRPPRQEAEWVCDGLHALAEFAAGQNVQIALEPMSHFRSHIANTPTQIRALLTGADHPNLGVVLDTYHLVTEIRDYRAAICEFRKELRVLHACENDRGVPGGGLVPWDQVFAACAEIAFDGCVLLESYNSSIGDFAHERGMFHNVCPDGEAFARDGLRFLRQGLGQA